MVFMSSHEIFSLSNTAATRLTPNGTHSGMDITISAQDEPFTSQSPVNLDSADRFHMSFSYIAE